MQFSTNLPTSLEEYHALPGVDGKKLPPNVSQEADDAFMCEIDSSRRRAIRLQQFRSIVNKKPLPELSDIMKLLDRCIVTSTREWKPAPEARPGVAELQKRARKVLQAMERSKTRKSGPWIPENPADLITGSTLTKQEADSAASPEIVEIVPAKIRKPRKRRNRKRRLGDAPETVFVP